MNFLAVGSALHQVPHHGPYAHPVRERSAALNAALQAAYFVVGVRAAGLAAGPMTGFDAEGVRKEFLDDDHTPLMIVNIGRPAADASHPRGPRLSYDDVVTTA